MKDLVKVTIEVLRPDMGEEGMKYKNQRLQPLEWVLQRESRSFLVYYIEEMIDELRDAMKGRR
jgi:hypothetical protein